jgi:hypothetical protein
MVNRTVSPVVAVPLIVALLFPDTFVPSTITSVPEPETGVTEEEYVVKLLEVEDKLTTPAAETAETPNPAKIESAFIADESPDAIAVVDVPLDGTV